MVLERWVDADGVSPQGMGDRPSDLAMAVDRTDPRAEDSGDRQSLKLGQRPRPSPLAPRHSLRKTQSPPPRPKSAIAKTVRKLLQRCSNADLTDPGPIGRDRPRAGH